MSIVIIGHSHTRAIKNWLKKYSASADLENEYSVHWLKNTRGTHGDIELSDAERLVANLKPDDKLVFSLLGTSHNIFGLLKHSTPFTIAEAQPPESQYLIPISVINDFFINIMKKNETLVNLRNLAKCKVYHLITPPPKGSRDFIANHGSVYRDVDITTSTINNSSNRLALWKAEMRSLARYCKSLDIEIIEAPASTLDSKGFLKDTYYANDTTHANINYGQDVLLQLEKLQ